MQATKKKQASPPPNLEPPPEVKPETNGHALPVNRYVVHLPGPALPSEVRGAFRRQVITAAAPEEAKAEALERVTGAVGRFRTRNPSAVSSWKDYLADPVPAPEVMTLAQDEERRRPPPITVALGALDAVDAVNGWCTETAEFFDASAAHPARRASLRGAAGQLLLVFHGDQAAVAAVKASLVEVQAKIANDLADHEVGDAGKKAERLRAAMDDAATKAAAATDQAAASLAERNEAVAAGEDPGPAGQRYRQARDDQEMYAASVEHLRPLVEAADREAERERLQRRDGLAAAALRDAQVELSRAAAALPEICERVATFVAASSAVQTLLRERQTVEKHLRALDRPPAPRYEPAAPVGGTSGPRYVDSRGAEARPS